MRPRTFKALRKVDETGVSGPGHIADGVVFEDGTTVLRWRTECRSTAVYASFEDMEKIHGHNGATVFEFDGKGDAVTINFHGAQLMNERDLDAFVDRIGKTLTRRILPGGGFKL